MREYKGVALNKANVEWAVERAIRSAKVGNEMLEMASDFDKKAEEIIKSIPVEDRTPDNAKFASAAFMIYMKWELRRLYGKMMN